MKTKYIQPAMKQMDLEEDLMLTISNTQGDEGQFLNEGLFDELDDELDDNIKAAETEARSSNIYSLNVWER
ncbi:MAG: hypothetical protein IKT00_03040 [Prevotella sp.]|nr:hypothetical protein [Prevotella sp.]